jgi:hypothetical protein
MVTPDRAVGKREVASAQLHDRADASSLVYIDALYEVPSFGTQGALILAV